MIEAKLCNPLLPEQLERQFASLAARLETVDRRVTAALADEDMRTVLQGAAPLFHPALTPEQGEASGAIAPVVVLPLLAAAAAAAVAVEVSVAVALAAAEPSVAMAILFLHSMLLLRL